MTKLQSVARPKTPDNLQYEPGITEQIQAMTASFQILILGYGEMGHAMEYLLKDHHQLAIWNKFPNAGFSSAVIEESAPHANIVLFCLPVNPHQEVVQQIAPLLKKTCLCVSIAKGLDETGKTAAQIFAQNLAENQPYALLYGPMISEEIRAGRYAFGQLGCRDLAAFQTMEACFCHTKLYIAHTFDITGISWSVILKNVYAMAFGMADELKETLIKLITFMVRQAHHERNQYITVRPEPVEGLDQSLLKLGDNVRGYLAVVALQELSQIVLTLGGQADSPYHLAGLGDLITTATSESSHHHELGRRLTRD
ncbi:NAD-dependent glycerol-3-phosphate dehydrogenase domain protein [Nitrosomonas sp. Is79A3]|uniref:NAD-dependent glycerol-3-phosphate dehydrogenase n=1 Tax=Nitrosomonas sp. (strain Is79A3) TaxID=261292 RepID=UPI000215CC56